MRHLICEMRQFMMCMVADVACYIYSVATAAGRAFPPFIRPFGQRPGAIVFFVQKNNSNMQLLFILQIDTIWKNRYNLCTDYALRMPSVIAPGLLSVKNQLSADHRTRKEQVGSPSIE